jgi:hypothetical protein
MYIFCYIETFYIGVPQCSNVEVYVKVTHTLVVKMLMFLRRTHSKM